jgi:hypothetical protein
MIERALSIAKFDTYGNIYTDDLIVMEEYAHVDSKQHNLPCSFSFECQIQVVLQLLQSWL